MFATEENHLIVKTKTMNQKQLCPPIFLIVCHLLVLTVLAIPPGSNRPWAKVEAGSLGSVNLSNRTLNFGIPLLNVGGRGSTEIPLTLRLSEENWRLWSYYWTLDPIGGSYTNIHCWTIGLDSSIISQCQRELEIITNLTEVRKQLRPYLDNPVDIGYGPGALVLRHIVSDRGQCYAPNPGPNGGNSPTHRLEAHRPYLEFTNPDGSKVEFVDKNSYGDFDVGVCYPNTPTYISRGNVLVSTGGERMIFEPNPSIPLIIGADIYGIEYHYRISGTMHLPDGTKYEIIQGLIQKIIDPNGNVTTFSYDENAEKWSKSLTSIVDSMGRTVTINYNVQDSAPYGLSDHIKYHGIDNEDKIIKISKTPLANALRSDFTIRTQQQLWISQDDSSFPHNPPINPVVPSALWLPDGTNYKFQYNSHVEVARVETPTGAAVEYDYTYGSHITAADSGLPLTRIVTEKRVYHDSSAPNSLETRTTYNYAAGILPNSELPYGAGAVAVDIFDSQNNRIQRTKSYFTSSGGYAHITEGMGPGSGFDVTNWLNGLELRTEVYAPNGTTLLSRTEKKWINGYIPWVSDQNKAPAFDPRPVAIVGVTFENGKALSTLTKIEYDQTGPSDVEYFAHLNVKKQKSYHFKAIDLNTAVNSSATAIASMYSESDLATVEEIVYSYSPTYKSRYIIGLPTEKRVLNPLNPNDILAKSQPVYDETVYFDNSYTTSGWEDPNSTLRGNVTTARTWNKDTNTWIESHTMFDNFGNVRKVWDTSGDPNKFVETQYDPIYKYAYPTKVISPDPDPTNTHGTNQTSTAETTYDFSTGLPLTVKNEFGQITRTEYDGNLRPVRMFADNFTAPESQTIYGVPDSNGQLPASERFVKVRKQIDGTNWDEAITWFDGLGRTIKTQAKDSQGDVFVDMVYDAIGRVERVTNPYRQGDTVLWSKTRYDEMGRAVESFAPAELPNLGSAQSLGITSFDISTVPNFVGTVVTSTDASGRKGRSITNALGQLLRVDEPTGIGGTADADLGTLASPLQPTFYKYDLYGKMVEVTQGVQKRWFKYDSLGRLIRVRQPEQEINLGLNLSDAYNTSGQWTAGFTYDVLGNVLTATDANGVTITNTYDNAGRVKTRVFSGEPQGQTTAPVSFYYDGKGLAQQQSPNYAKGKLTKVTSSVSESQYKLFDNMGRLTESSQITDGQTYTSKYTYNLSGALVEEEYPSGRKVRNEFETDGDLLKVSSQKNSSTVLIPYVSNFSYTASGGISQMRLGNGRWETAKFNTKLQVTELGLGNSATDASVWKTAYEYGELQTNGTVDAAKNTGNIAKQTLTVPGTSFVQSYKYDSLYRMTEATEKTGTTTNWSQQFNYDRYGNRTAINQAIGQLTLNTTPAVDENTNRFTSTDFGYDKNGNAIADIDPNSTLPRSFVFNGDNKQAEVKRDGVTVGRYYYDGEGKRVKKVTDQETTVFVYSAGKLIAEYSTQISQTPQTKYLTEDHLGTPRIITNQLGEVIARRDFMPFGEELFNGIGARSENLNYGTNADDVKQKFTGYQKDNETGLDFAEARMYENRHGRFTAVDPLLASGKSANPQTFNRYVYVGNNPLDRVDPSGLDWVKSVRRTLLYNGKIRVRIQPVWKADAVGHKKWDGGAIYKASTGRWVTLDPWSGHSTLSATKAQALVALDGYRKQTVDNVIGGAVRPLADTVNLADAVISSGGRNIITPGRPGLGTVLENAALSSAGVSPDENSQVFQTTTKVVTAMQLVGGGVSAAAGGTGLLTGAASRFGAVGSRGGGLNLYRFGSAQAEASSGWKTGDYFLHLPDQGSAKLNWKQNYGALRRAMNSGEPISDSYRTADGSLIPARTVDPNTGAQSGAFLNAERSTLLDRGRTFNYRTGEWQ